MDFLPDLRHSGPGVLLPFVVDLSQPGVKGVDQITQVLDSLDDTLEADLASVIQSALFFGLLSVVLGDELDMASFRGDWQDPGKSLVDCAMGREVIYAICFKVHNIKSVTELEPRRRILLDVVRLPIGRVESILGGSSGSDHRSAVNSALATVYAATTVLVSFLRSLITRNIEWASIPHIRRYDAVNLSAWVC